MFPKPPPSLVSVQPEYRKVLGHSHWAWPAQQSPGSPLCLLLRFQFSSHPRQFLQCCVNHFTELSPLQDPGAPNRITSDMLIFASGSIITLANFPKECLACHRLLDSLMIKKNTEAPAIDLPAIETDLWAPIPCLPKSLPQEVLIISPFKLKFQI